DTGLSLYHEGYRIGGTTRPQRFIKMGEVCRVPEHNRALMNEWFAHPTFDEYWAAEDCSQHFSKMNVPCFTVGSWYDFMSVGSIDSYVGRQHHGGPNSRGKQQLYIGPWLHGRFNKQAKVNELTYPDNANFDMLTHMGKWFDHYLKGVDNGVDRDPAVRYYVMGAVGEKDAPGNEWRSAKDWPIPSRPTKYFLQADGKLNTQQPTVERSETAWISDPLHPAEIPATSGFPGAKDARPFESQKNVLTFTSEPLTEAVEWTGKVQAEIYLTSTAKDTDVIVRVTDVYPDGRSMLIIDYVRRARYREGYEKEVPLEPGKVAKVAFDVGSLSQIFNKGHRIRVTLASTGAPFYEPNPQNGKPLTIDFPDDAVVATNTVRHDKEFSSKLIAPVVKTSR
ncbi:MAG TPA: CocE/NonD family hydrolase, partial [Planctomycetaceae bacterium]|nr:CocE/NonD family hydrolase [Planctomycetaceae bacterium]